MVRAIDVRTVGLGGDSMVAVEGASIVLRPERVVPLSLAAHRAPEIIKLLEADLADVRTGGALHGRFVLRPDGTSAATDVGELGERERAVLDALGDRPRPLRELAGTSRAMGVIDGLRRRGIVQLAGFTPSDAAHVLGRQATWSTPAALLGARLGARLLDMRSPTEERTLAFAQRVWEATVTRSARAVLDTALGSAAASPLLDAVCAGRPLIGAARVTVTPTVPVVAVGGPVRVFYGEVGTRLGCEVVFPERYEVANAVGAATGAVVRSVRIEVNGDGGGSFRVHGPDGVVLVVGAEAAITAAEATARSRALADLEAMGAGEADVRVGTRRWYLPGRDDDGGLLTAVVVAEAVGRPHGR